MNGYGTIPTAGEDGPELAGHLWLLEWVEGSPLRFGLRESGAIRFGGERGAYRDDDAVPRECRRAVAHVRARLDRGALRSAVPDATDLTFVGRATHRDRVDYDWARLPPFLGLDVWSAEAGAYRPPDAAERIFEGLGLEPADAIRREVNSRDFAHEDYGFPPSAWYDGPAAGVVIRDKRGQRALLENSGISERSGTLDAADAAALADAVATDRRLDRVAARLRDRGTEPTVDRLRDGLLRDVYREEHGRLPFGERDIDRAAFRSAVARRAGRYWG